jgi:epoxyqueuosine reductase
MMPIKDKTLLLREMSTRYGFSEVGIARAEHLPDAADRLEQWLHKGYHGSMSYMENHFDLRVDPTKLVPGARSVVSFLYNYMPEEESLSQGTHKISRYAYGRDYHKVIKKKLKNLMGELRDELGDFTARVFTDSAPVMICDLELEYDAPISDHCGTCTKCIDACPTDAIDKNGYILDANKCISYLTIERKDSLPEEFRSQMEGWMFGCDICQEVCPWNRFSTVHQEADFHPKEALLDMQKKDWEEITDEVFDKLFLGSAVKRTKIEGLRRNIAFLKREE